jgi:hypothetical protein
VVEVALDRIPELVARGEIRHALMLSSFYLLGLAGGAGAFLREDREAPEPAPRVGHRA